MRNLPLLLVLVALCGEGALGVGAAARAADASSPAPPAPGSTAFSSTAPTSTAPSSTAPTSTAPSSTGPDSTASAPAPPASTGAADPAVTKRIAAYLDAKDGAPAAAALDPVVKDGAAAVPGLLGRLRAEVLAPYPDPSVVGRLDEALARIGYPALPPLIATVRDSEAPAPIRAEAARVFGRIQGARGVLALVEVLSQTLQSGPASLAARLVEVLGDIGDPRPVPALEQALTHPDPSVRFAAATALGKLGDPTAVPYLLRTLDDPDLAASAAANRALIRLSGADQGYAPDAPDAQRSAAIARWRDWWSQNQGRFKVPTQPDASAIWKRLDDILAWAVLRRPMAGMGQDAVFPGPPGPADSAVIVSSAHLPAGALPVVEGRRVVVQPESALNPVPREGYWRFDEPAIAGEVADVTVHRIVPGAAPRSATLHLRWGPAGWQFASATPGQEEPASGQTSGRTSGANAPTSPPSSPSPGSQSPARREAPPPSAPAKNSTVPSAPAKNSTVPSAARSGPPAGAPAHAVASHASSRRAHRRHPKPVTAPAYRAPVSAAADHQR